MSADEEQPYERVLNDAAQLLGYEADFFVLVGGFLLYFFGSAVLLTEVFGSLWTWVWWLLFFASIVLALVTAAMDSFGERYSRRG